MRVVGAFSVVVVVTTASQARAEDDPVRVQATKLAYDGVSAFQAGDYQTASKKLEKAFAILPVPSIGLYSARSLVSLGLLLEGERRYRQIAELSVLSGDRAVQEDARKQAAAELEGLLTKVPRLRIQIEGAPLTEVQISVDGVSIDVFEAIGERPMNPGNHHIEARRGQELVAVDTAVAEGARSVALVRFAERAAKSVGAAPSAIAAAPAPTTALPRDVSALKMGGWVGIGVGGASLVLSGLGALVANSKKPNDCNEHVCQGSVEGYNNWRTVSTVSFWAGSALALGGAVLVLVIPSKSLQGSEVAVSVSPSGFSVRGTY